MEGVDVADDKPFLQCVYCDDIKELEGFDDPSILLTNCQACDRKGTMQVRSKYFFKGKFNSYFFVKALRRSHLFICIRDNDGIYIYDNDLGYWKAGESFIIDELTNRLRLLYQRKFLDECISVIKGTTHVERDILNSKEDLINLRNGTFDLKELKLLEHSPENYFTYALPITYDESAECPKILKFVTEICEPDVRKIITLLEGFALCLRRGYPIQKAVVLVGGGANGKSTLLNVLRAFLGKENAASLTLQQIAMGNFALPYLMGKLANISPDLPSTKLIDVGRFKALTGDDTILADQKHRGMINLLNSAKLWFSANRIPPVLDDSDAYFRRFQIVELTNTFEKSDPNLIKELTKDGELAGLFNLIVQVFYQAIRANDRFTYEKEVAQIRKDYLMNSDSSIAFITQATEANPDVQIPKAEFYEMYKKFCDANDLVKLPDNAFFRSVREYVGASYMERHARENGIQVRKIIGLNVVDGYDKERRDINDVPTDPTTIFLGYIQKYGKNQDFVRKLTDFGTGSAGSAGFFPIAALKKWNINIYTAYLDNPALLVEPVADNTTTAEQKKTTDVTVTAFLGVCDHCGKSTDCIYFADKITCMDCLDKLHREGKGA